MNRILVYSQQTETIRQTLEVNFELATDVLSDGALLWARLADRPYALFLLDVTLAQTLAPNGDLLLRLAARYPGLAVLLLTEASERHLAIDYLEQGAVDFLLLPLNPTELCVRIRRCLPQASAVSGQDTFGIMQRAIQEMLQTLQIEKAPEVLLANFRAPSGAGAAKLWLADNNGAALQPASSLGEWPGEFDHFLFELAQKVAQSREMISRKLDLELPGQTLNSILLLPLLSANRVIGVVALGHATETGIPATQLRWLLMFSRIAAIAIDNARLFHKLSLAYVDQTQSRDKILRSRNTLQALFDGISDGLYILSEDMSISAINQVEARFFERLPEDMVGESFLSLNGPATAPTFINRITASLETGREQVWIPSKDEHATYFKDREFRIYPVLNRGAQTGQVIIFAHDVSGQRQWQANLFRSASLAAVGQLAASVAHQINNPLTAIMTYGGLIAQDAEPGSEFRDFAAYIIKHSERITAIVANLREFSGREDSFGFLSSLSFSLCRPMP
jgi:signal transduction histidine kinase/FixJ family two-component response regulator